MSPVTPFEIVKRTPKTNCQQCGYQTCLAFGAAVATRGEDLGKCPYVKRTGLALSEAKVLGDNQQKDLELVRHLKEKIAGLNFSRLAERLGCSITIHPDETLAFQYLGQDVASFQKRCSS
jgi:Na+-translocating ferredoxin:NAD+ oxidoreductase RNF subunit RnfB